MHTERIHGDGGFTLVEVLFALVILSVGLLALETMGIAASTRVRRAEATSTYAAIAADEMETAMNQLARTPPVAQSQNRTGTGGARVFRTVTTTAIGATGFSRYTVNVRVLPPTSGAGVVRAGDSINVTSDVVR